MAKLLETRQFSNNVSKLSLGTGRVAQYKETTRIDLQFDHRNYESLVSTRTKPRLLFTFTESTLGKEAKVIRRSPISVTGSTENGMSHPKTRLSDRKVTKEKMRQSPLPSKSDNWDVMGQSIVRPKSSASNSKWIQLVGRKKGRLISAWSSNSSSRREKDRYIKSRASDRSYASEPIPYSWNYAVPSSRIISPTNQKGIKTVKGLSEAVLAYKKEEKIDSDTSKYLELIRQKWKNRTDIEKQQLILDGRLYKVTDWTRDWINVHRNFLRGSRQLTEEDTRANTVEKAKTKPTPKPSIRKAKRQTRFAWDSEYDKYSRAPTNTPMSHLHRTLTRSSIRSLTHDHLQQ